MKEKEKWIAHQALILSLLQRRAQDVLVRFQEEPERMSEVLQREHKLVAPFHKDHVLLDLIFFFR